MTTTDRITARNLDVLMEQVRALQAQVGNLSAQLSAVQAQVTDTQGNVPTVHNYVDNGDFSFTEEGYSTSTYVGDDQDCARWYTRTSDAAGQWTEHTTTVQSPDFLKNDNTLATYWDKSQGVVALGGKKAVAQALVKNVALPGLALFCTMQLRLKTGETIDPTYKLKASIWDNTSGIEKTVESAPFDITATPAVASPGAFSRKYILRVDTNSTFFYSDVLTPVTVNNQVSVDVIDNTNFVTVRWTTFPEAIRYRLYRFDSEHSEWRLIANIANAAVQFDDKGGRIGELFTPPVANVNLKAEAFFENFAFGLVDTEFRDALLTIRVPSAYVYSATTNKQWLRIDVVDEDNNFVTLGNGVLLIDKVALGYTSGRWSFSAKDLQVPAAIASTSPPPTIPPGDNEPAPDDGGGRYGIKAQFDTL